MLTGHALPVRGYFPQSFSSNYPANDRPDDAPSTHHRRSLRLVLLRTLLAVVALTTLPPLAQAQCPTTVPVDGAPPPGPLPLFPADNWWNVDITSAPVDPNSAAYIAFINNGGTRRPHPDFGGEVSAGSTDVYGMPYAIVDGAQPKQAVTFDYWDESDGVDYSTGRGLPFYPIPSQAITQPHWIEGGAPGNVDARTTDRHLLVIDCTNRYLYELWNVFYDTAQARWYAGSGAFFDMNVSDRRPEGWTSADAAGLAIFPGLVRYDEAWNPAVAEIGHAFRVTVRATNGHVYPASHSAGSTAGALPMGARLRLKASVGGSDPALRTSDPNVRKIFRAMQKHGLIVADNGSDMYVSGTFDTRWNNSVLNPAFALLSAGDFEVVRLGWNPPPDTSTTASLGAISVNPSRLVGGAPATGTVSLTSAAPSGGAVVTLASSSASVSVPGSVLVGAGATAATFQVATSGVTSPVSATLSATYTGVTKTTVLAVDPPAQTALDGLVIDPAIVTGGGTATGNVSLTTAAPPGGATVALSSSDSSIATVPQTVLVPEGTTSATFAVTTAPPRKRRTSATITAAFAGATRSVKITITK